MEWIEYCKQYIPLLASVYKERMGLTLNLDNPSTFTEKMQWLKIYDSNFLKTFCADKISLHQYCKSVLGHDICIPIIGTYNNANEITFDSLPSGSVFKCNHGSGYNIIHKPGTHIDNELVKKKLNNWLLEDFSSRNGCELHYKLIPRKILIEPYMNDGHGTLVDYKFYCFNGNPIFCQVITDRYTHETISHYADGWTYAPQYDQIEYNSLPNIPRPVFYDEMYEFSRKLSAAFKVVRVDFYIIGNKLYLGELTFTPNSGFHHFKHPATNKELGDMIVL